MLNVRCAAVTVAALASVSSAAPLLITGTSGNLAATALFDVSGTSLIVTLTNTSTSDVQAPADVLTAMFFNISGLPLTLGRSSAVLGVGSTVAFGTTDPGNVVGGEWAYASGLSGAPGNAAYGISSTGLNLFGPGDVFPGNNLQGPANVDGLQYGITSAGDNLATGNAAVTGGNALIQNRVVFTLTGLPAGFDPATRISGVSFQYGTVASEPNVPGTPTPGGLGVIGAAGVLAARRRHSR